VLSKAQEWRAEGRLGPDQLGLLTLDIFLRQTPCEVRLLVEQEKHALTPRGS
jgi:hypothetical protein